MAHLAVLLKLLLSILTCAISFPPKLFQRSEWPTISMEEANHPGGFLHRWNSYWVTTVRYNANFLAKAFAFSLILNLILCLI